MRCEVDKDEGQSEQEGRDDGNAEGLEADQWADRILIILGREAKDLRGQSCQPGAVEVGEWERVANELHCRPDLDDEPCHDHRCEPISLRHVPSAPADYNKDAEYAVRHSD